MIPRISQGSLHEGCNPKLSAEQELSLWTVVESSDHPRHQISDDDQVADANAEAFDGNRRIKNYSSIRIGDLTQGEEAGRASVQIPRTSRLKVQAKTRCNS